MLGDVFALAEPQSLTEAGETPRNQAGEPDLLPGEPTAYLQRFSIANQNRFTDWQYVNANHERYRITYQYCQPPVLRPNNAADLCIINLVLVVISFDLGVIILDCDVYSCSCGIDGSDGRNDTANGSD